MWKLDNNKPIYLQLIEQLVNKIVSGEFSVGERVPGVRELAEQAGVNPNTMQRAMQELEARGLICTQRTAGRSITTDANVIAHCREQLLCEQGKAYLQAAQALGCGRVQAIDLLNEISLEE